MGRDSIGAPITQEIGHHCGIGALEDCPRAAEQFQDAVEVERLRATSEMVCESVGPGHIHPRRISAKLSPQRPETGHVIHASWIDESSVISDAQAGAIWREKLERGERELAILFVGRLDHQKGVAVLLDAIRSMASKQTRVTLDILGSGGLLPMCRQLSDELRGPTRVNVLGTSRLRRASVRVVEGLPRGGSPQYLG